MSKESHTLAIDVTHNASTVDVRLVGDVDLGNSPRLRAALLEIVAARPRRVIMDLSGVGYMDSSGMGTIVEFRRKVDPAGEVLVLAGLQPRVRSVMEITKLDHFFRIVETVAEARRR